MTTADELLTLASYWCEGELHDTQCRRLQDLLRSDDQLRALFVRYIQLHGQLAWDCAGAPLPAAGPDEDWDDNPEAWQSAAIACCSDPDLALPLPTASRHSLPQRLRLPAALAGLAFVILWSVLTISRQPTEQLAQRSANAPAAPSVNPIASAPAQPLLSTPAQIPEGGLPPLRLPAVASTASAQAAPAALVQTQAPPSTVASTASTEPHAR